MQLHGKESFEEDGKIFCTNCYSRLGAASKCQKCKGDIISGRKITLKEKYSWHEKCFVCKRCQTSVVGAPYYVSGETDLCCAECQADHKFVAQCQGCKNAISSTVKYLKHEECCWHPECFKCVICHVWLANGKFHTNANSNLVCAECFATKVSKKCAQCQKAIVTKGIQYGLMVYHPECFKCTTCNKNVAHESKVKSSDGQIKCQECYLMQATKCFRCHGPIISRFTVYKGKKFHIECFKCNSCGINIEGDEFYETSLNEILCSKCV